MKVPLGGPGPGGPGAYGPIEGGGAMPRCAGATRVRRVEMGGIFRAAAAPGRGLLRVRLRGLALRAGRGDVLARAVLLDLEDVSGARRGEEERGGRRVSGGRTASGEENDASRFDGTPRAKGGIPEREIWGEGGSPARTLRKYFCA